MHTENSIALKEWATVCLALAEGRQSLLIRKGGIAEGSGGFRFEHEQFWLFPTQFHQTPDQLTAEGAALLRRVSAPPAGRLVIDCYAIVRSVAFLHDEQSLASLQGHHVLSSEVVRERFHYRRPGLFIAAVEVFRRPPVELADDPRFAGCHSWVDLGAPLSTAGATPVSTAIPVKVAVDFVESLRASEDRRGGDSRKM